MSRRTAFYILCFIGIALYNLNFTVRSPRLDFFDEGSALYASRQIALGDVLYRDQLYYKMPLSYYLLGAIFAVTGTSILTSRIVIACIGAVITLMTIFISANLMPWRWALFTALLYYPWTIPQRNIYHNGWIALLCILSVQLVVFRFDEQLRKKSAFLVGFLLALTILAKQVHGFYTILAVFGWLAFRVFGTLGSSSEQNRFSGRSFLHRYSWSAGWVVIGLISCMVLIFSYFAWHGALGDFLYYTCIYPLTTSNFAEGIGLPFPWTRDVVELLAFALLPIIYSITLWYLLRSGRRVTAGIRRKVVFLVILGITNYGCVYPRPDFYHLLYSIFPGFCCVTYLLHAFARAIRTRISQTHGYEFRRAVFISPILVCTLLIMGGAVYKIIAIYKTPVQPLDVAAGFGISTSPDDVRTVARSVKFIREHSAATGTVYVGPWAPALYILGQRRNPTRIRMFVYGHFSQDHYMNEIVSDLTQDRTPLIVWVHDETIQQLRGPDPEGFALPILQYLATWYERRTVIGPFSFWLRRDLASTAGDGMRLSIWNCNPSGE